MTRRPGDLYECPKCHAAYPHDGGYRHEVFECPARAQSVKRRRDV